MWFHFWLDPWWSLVFIYMDKKNRQRHDSQRNDVEQNDILQNDTAEQYNNVLLGVAIYPTMLSIVIPSAVTPSGM